MPKEKSKIFLNVFRKLKQRVLWKWEDDNIENKPDNVMIGEWLPQNDILGNYNLYSVNSNLPSYVLSHFRIKFQLILT